MTAGTPARAPATRSGGLFQFVFDRSLSRNRQVARVFRLARRGAARVHDALVAYPFHGRTLMLPLSHDLPTHRWGAPIYSDNLRRLAGFVRRQAGRLCMIDVGANVGDSWALAGSEPGDAFLLVEGSERWFRLLELNTAGAPGVERVRCLIADRPGERAARVIEASGTGRPVEDGGGATATLRTVDELVAERPAFRAANLLKVDVDGWDGRVLRGARGLLAAAGPALLFECHPGLLAAAGDDAGELLAWLADLGYRRFVIYENRGTLVAAIGAGDRAPFRALLDEAGRRGTEYYYDVAAFRDPDAAARFLAGEREFYAADGR
jgi:FkbM family methyltransferase